MNLKDLYYDYTIGDPTTYPSSRDKIKTWIPGEGLTPLGQFSPSTVISPGNGQTTSISLSQSVGGTLAVSLGFDIDSKTYAKGHADLGFVAGGEVDGQIGYTVGSSQELGAELSLSVNGAIGGTLNSPDTKNTAYQFSTAMAAWATFRKVPVAVGFTVTGTEPGKEMPLPPLHPYVYATGKTWAMLAWDQPPEGGRWADGYKIYQDDAATPTEWWETSRCCCLSLPCDKPYPGHHLPVPICRHERRHRGGEICHRTGNYPARQWSRPHRPEGSV